MSPKYYTCLMSDGSRLPLEAWVIRLYDRNELSDPHLLAICVNAVAIYPQK